MACGCFYTIVISCHYFVYIYSLSLESGTLAIPFVNSLQISSSFEELSSLVTWYTVGGLLCLEMM